MFWLAWSSVLTLVLAAESPAATPLPPRLDPEHPADLAPLLAPICQRREVPGMVGAIVEGNRLVAIGAVGVRKAGGAEKVTTADQFHIGSDTKAMTATLAAMLVETGKIAWDSTLAEVFPELATQMKPAFRRVTLEDLLTHRGGFPRNVPYQDPNRPAPTTGAELIRERVRILRRAVEEEPKEPAFGKFVYSNAGYVAAGAMLERVTGKSWEELITARLFKPLGMSSAGFGAPGTAAVVDQPRGHDAQGKPVEPGPGADNPAALGPAGTVHCSIGDWAKFVALHLRGAQGDVRLLKPTSFARLLQPFPADAPDRLGAMGWIVTERRWGDGPVLTHTGSNNRWFAVVWLAPRRDFAVLAACNRGDTLGSLACDDACWWLVNYFLSQRSVTPAAEPGTAPDRDE